MKLKKIASLALAGVMAVSMLAGCSNGSNGNANSGNGGEGNNVPSTSAVVDAFNNGQDEDNKVKVNFTSDTSLDAALQKAVSKINNSGTAVPSSVVGTVKVNLYKILGKGGTLIGSTYTATTLDNNKKTDGTVTVKMDVLPFSSDDYWSETAALEEAARTVNDEIAKLKENSKTSAMKDGEEFSNFTYTGNVSVVAQQQTNGNVAYYIAYTITQTAANDTI